VQDTPLPPQATAVSPTSSAAPPAATNPAVLAFTLMPPTRGIDEPPIVTITGTAKIVDLHVVLEPNDLQVYEVALKDPGSDRVIWQGERLNARTLGDHRVVVVRLDATALQPQRYLLDLTAVPATQEPELVASYPFQLVLQ
jgi:hypothetical protein